MTQGRTGSVVAERVAEGARAPWHPRDGVRFGRPLPDWVHERDWVLMTLLAFLNVGSLLTTVLGARQLLPSPMAEILGFSIQAMLFLMLAGFAGQHAPVRKWLVVAIFASACVYCSFFTYYGQLGKKGDDARQLALAQERHADLVQAVFADGKAEGERLRREAAALERQAEDEATRGSSTGVTGYGPRAKQMRAEANAAVLAAERHLAIVEQLEPLFVFEIADLTPKQVFDRDLAAWQAAPAEWRKEYPKPQYDGYVDQTVQAEFLAPVQRVRQGDLVATVSLSLASLVDGMAILLGTAIERRKRKPIVETGASNLAGLVRSTKAGLTKVREAWSSPSHDHDVISLHVRDGVQFLSRFYEAIHVDNKQFDFDGLLRRDADERLAARVLFDRLLSRKWMVQKDGKFFVADAHYNELTMWLSLQIAHVRRTGRAEGEFEIELPWSARSGR